MNLKRKKVREDKELTGMNLRIREVRKDKKLTQEKLGNIMGLSRDSITSIENSRVQPSELFINHFCEKFKVNKDWLFNGIKPKYYEEDDIIAGILADITVNPSHRLKNLLKEINDLDDEYLDLIEKLVKGLKK
jgi:transcriptional regulator with XRE-family HTH domain